MTELKPDSQIDSQIGSQLIRSVEAQPEQKRARGSKAVKAATQASAEPPSATPELSEDPPKRKRRTTPSTKTAKPKNQATSRSNQIATTQVKLSWEPSSSNMGARFLQLEQELQQLKGQATEVNEQISSILVEMEELKAIAREVTGIPEAETRKPLDLMTFGNSPEKTVIQSVSEEPNPQARKATQPNVEVPSRSPQDEWATETVQTGNRQVQTGFDREDVGPERPYGTRPAATVLQSTPISPFPVSDTPLPSPTRRRPQRRPKTLRIYVKQLQELSLRIPRKPLFIAIDSVLWVLAAAGLQYVLKLLAVSVPSLSAPVASLIVIPACYAAYAAFFSPNANAIAIYRLLLVTLGLFVGGKL